MDSALLGLLVRPGKVVGMKPPSRAAQVSAPSVGEGDKAELAALGVVDLAKKAQIEAKLESSGHERPTSGGG